MKHLDMADTVFQENAEAVVNAASGDDKTAAIAAFIAMQQSVSERVMAEAAELANVTDVTVLAQRGVRQLTAKERGYYEKVISALKSNNPRQEITNLDVVMPETVFDMVFENITESHPLLSRINFTNTGAAIKWIMSTTSGVAGWGELCAEIVDELGASFSILDMTLNKLSAFILVCSAMLDLGPVWLDRYVRLILSEALAVELEAAIVDGDGKNKPIGMTRKLSGSVDGVYPRKTAISVKNLNPETIGGILGLISKAPNNKRRAVPRLLMVVNPADYYTRVFPATTVRTTDGGYNTNVFPYPVDVEISAAMPEGYASFGLASKYFMALGSAKGGKLEYSDEYKFLEDERAYKIKLYGNGRAMDENAFVLADISELEATVFQVELIDGLPEA